MAGVEATTNRSTTSASRTTRPNRSFAARSALLNSESLRLRLKLKEAQPFVPLLDGAHASESGAGGRDRRLPMVLEHDRRARPGKPGAKDDFIPQTIPYSETPESNLPYENELIKLESSDGSSSIIIEGGNH